MSRSRTEVNQILCNPIVSDTHYEILMAQKLAQIEATQRSAHVTFQADIEHKAAAEAPVEAEAVATKEDAIVKDAAAADALESYGRQLDMLDKFLLAELERDVRPAAKVEPPKENSGVNDKEPVLDERDVTAETIAEEQGSDEEARRLSKKREEMEIQALLREVLSVGQDGAQAMQTGDKDSRSLAMNKILMEIIQQLEKGEQQQQQRVPETSGQEEISEAYRTVYEEEGEEKDGKRKDEL